MAYMTFLASALLAAPLVSAHLALYSPGMYCPENQYEGPLKNATDPFIHVYDPIYQLSGDDWFLSKGKNCWLAEPTGVWEIAANSEISVPWADWANSTGYYADGKEQDQRPIPYSVTNPQVKAENLVSGSGGISAPNLHAGNKSTAAGTALGIAYVDDIYKVTMDNIVIFSIAPNTPFERLANYSIPDLAPCELCICVSAWIPHGYGEQNMYQSAHKCKITNPTGGKKPKTPSRVPGPGVTGPKQLIVAFQKEGNTVPYTPGGRIPVYDPSMGYAEGAQHDIFDYGNENGTLSSSTTRSTPPTLTTVFVEKTVVPDNVQRDNIWDSVANAIFPQSSSVTAISTAAA